MTTSDQNYPIRVMLVDDSAVIRGIFNRVLASEPDIEVVCSAGNGEIALNNLDRYDIEVVILDIEMPVMDGLTALPKLIAKQPNLQVIMASTLTRRNAEISIRALSNGAKDYVPKPESSKELEEETFQHDLLSKIRALAEVKRTKAGEPLPKGTAQAKVTSVSDLKKPTTSIRQKSTSLPSLRRPSMARPEIITIGSSTGGPQALSAVLKDIHQKVTQPIIITQHMPPTFTSILAEHLSKDCNIKCKEAVDGDVIEPQNVYVAPGGYHLTLVVEGGKKIVRLTQEPPENFCRPSVDPMLRSITNIYGSRMLTIILTGMGTDGLKGAELVSENGGTVIAQDEATSIVWGMPGAVSQAGLCSAILPLNDIPSKIKEYVG